MLNSAKCCFVAIAVLTISAGCGDSRRPPVDDSDDNDTEGSPLCQGKTDDPACPSEGEGEGSTEADAGTDIESDSGTTAEDSGIEKPDVSTSCPQETVLYEGMVMACGGYIECVLVEDPDYCDWTCLVLPEKNDFVFIGRDQRGVLRSCTPTGAAMQPDAA